jgi:ABC-2 type transport system ATP-binding protein
MSSPLLHVENLSKVFYGKRKFPFLKTSEIRFVAVDHLSFQLKEGEILGILGPNGAGKTTLIEMLLGMLTPTAGHIHYFGKDFYKHRSEILQTISQASAYHKLPASLTVQENLEIIGRLYSIPLHVIRERIKTLLEQFGMEEFTHTRAGKLSAGQLTRVLLVKAFLTNPKILLLDEPTASLDPDIAKEVREFILRQQKERNVSIIITSHNMKEVAEVCDRALVMQRGVIIREDTPKGLAKSVALNTVSLTVLKNIDKAILLSTKNQWHYEATDSHIHVEMDESAIPSFLKLLTKEEVDYTHIEIKKPTLEDYFLTLTGSGK